MDFVKTIPIVVSGVFALSMGDDLMGIAPGFQSVVDGIVISIDPRVRCDGLPDDQFDRLLLDRHS